MGEVNICDCPFTEWCHEPRQRLQSLFRKEDDNYKVEDCVFYKMIKEHKEKDNG